LKPNTLLIRNLSPMTSGYASYGGGYDRPTPIKEDEEVGNLGPSKEAKDAVSDCIRVIEGCDPQDRGYLLNRLAQIYFGAKGAKQIRGALKSSSSKKKSKTSWKKEWEATTEYQNWQNHIEAHKGESPDKRATHQAEYESLRQCAFRVRDTLKPTSNDKGGGDDNPGEEGKANQETEIRSAEKEKP